MAEIIKIPQNIINIYRYQLCHYVGSESNDMYLHMKQIIDMLSNDPSIDSLFRKEFGDSYEKVRQLIKKSALLYRDISATQKRIADTKDEVERKRELKLLNQLHSIANIIDTSYLKLYYVICNNTVLQKVTAHRPDVLKAKQGRLNMNRRDIEGQENYYKEEGY